MIYALTQRNIYKKKKTASRLTFQQARLNFLHEQMRDVFFFYDNTVLTLLRMQDISQQ